MGLFQEQMDSIEVESYKDCVWYIPEIDKCKLPGAEEKYSKCTCKKDMKEFCIWITKFIRSTPKDVDLDKEVSESVANKYGLYVLDRDNEDSYLIDVLSKLFKGA